MTTLSRSDTKKQLQERQRDWLRQVLRLTGLKPARLAHGAELSDTTLTRLLNNPDYDGVLSELTIERIKTCYQVPGPGEDNRTGQALIFGEAEWVEAADLDPGTAQAIAALTGAGPPRECWRLRSGLLEGAGYLAGDLLLVDAEAAPQPHDLIKATVSASARMN